MVFDITRNEYLPDPRVVHARAHVDERTLLVVLALGRERASGLQLKRVR